MRHLDQHSAPRRAARWRGLLACLLLSLAPSVPVLGQEETVAAPVAAPPSVGDLAAALADPARREATLLTAVALAHTRARLQAGMATGEGGHAARLQEDRLWLEDLRARYGRAVPRSPVMDPAVWQVRAQLERHQLQHSALTSVLGPDLNVFVTQVFNRFDPQLAAAVLPQLLWFLETEATVIWSDLLTRADEDRALQAALADIDFGAPAGAVEPPRSSPDGPDARGMVAIIVEEAEGMGPPDPTRLARLRRELLDQMPQLAPPERDFAALLLHLGRLADGLNEQRYFHFTEGLLAIVTRLQVLNAKHADMTADFAAWLAALLPGVSTTFAPGFAAVDPRLNTTLAATFDVARSLARPASGQDPARHQQQLADAVARLALMIPDMDFYFGLPVRDPVAGGVDACTGIMTVLDPDGDAALTREVFDDCLHTLVALADQQAREPQLAGDPDGPFGEAYLQRELNLTSGQRINYGIGYLHERYATGCEPPVQALPNPLEWSYLATFMTWFAEQSPVFLQTPENEQRLARMREIGMELMRVVAEQVDCIAGAGAGVNDPVYRVTADYRGDLVQLGDGLRNAEREFRSQFLAPGADVALDGGAAQSTAYRPSNLMIGPCDPSNVCEMSGELSSTRALLGLFPDVYLVAEQTGLGKVEICYDRMEWVDRRSESVRSGDQNVANYFGHLAFDLKGRYVNQGAVTDLFAFRFRSPQEHHYMFAAATEEVLEDACPVEWIGTRIVTQLPEGRRGIVPNRLTYLSAPRTLPSRLLAANWEQGAEWRDWFVTGLGVEELPVAPAEDLAPRLGQHLQSLYRLEQDAVYGNFLQAASNPEFATMTPLNDAMLRLTTSKALLRTQVMLFYPQLLNDGDEFRMAVAGYGGLLDALVLTRLREQNVPVRRALGLAHERLERFQTQWQAVPEAVRRNGAVPESLAQAVVRLNALNEQHFVRNADSHPPRGTSGGH